YRRTCDSIAPFSSARRLKSSFEFTGQRFSAANSRGGGARCGRRSKVTWQSSTSTAWRRRLRWTRKRQYHEEGQSSLSPVFVMFLICSLFVQESITEQTGN